MSSELLRSGHYLESGFRLAIDIEARFSCSMVLPFTLNVKLMRRFGSSKAVQLDKPFCNRISSFVLVYM